MRTRSSPPRAAVPVTSSRSPVDSESQQLFHQPFLGQLGGEVRVADRFGDLREQVACTPSGAGLEVLPGHRRRGHLGNRLDRDAHRLEHVLALAGRLPAPILAERLGIHQARAAQWVRAAGATYSSYVELRLARDGSAYGTVCQRGERCQLTCAAGAIPPAPDNRAPPSGRILRT
jgi:hypothetical protein